MSKEPLNEQEQAVYLCLNIHLKLEPEDFDKLTVEQKLSAARVIVRQGYCNGNKHAILNDEYLGIRFPHIFIGIEKDGYAHS